jgi:hypothetical protein
VLFDTMREAEQKAVAGTMQPELRRLDPGSTEVVQLFIERLRR